MPPARARSDARQKLLKQIAEAERQREGWRHEHTNLTTAAPWQNKEVLLQAALPACLTCGALTPGTPAVSTPAPGSPAGGSKAGLHILLGLKRGA